MSKQIHVITGPRGSGKSTAIATFPPATKEAMASLLVVDTEDSMSDLHARMSKIGMPFDHLRAYERFPQDKDLLNAIAAGKLPWVSQTQRNSLTEFYLWFVDAMDKHLEKGKYKYLGIDTVEPIEAAMAAWAESNKAQSGWSGTKAYGRLETEAVRPLYENLMEAVARRGVEHIILTSHLKRVWEDDKPILNKVQPGGRLVVLSRLSSEMYWLVPTRDNADGAPAAVVLKARKGSLSVVDGRWAVRRVLPERIPHFTWADVISYESNPADLARPRAGEQLTVDDRAMISEFLSDEQMRLMVLGAEIELRSMETPNVPMMSVASLAEAETTIREMITSGTENTAILTAVPGATLPMVIKLRRVIREETDSGGS